MNWYCEAFHLLLVRHWEDEVFVYNPLTSHTHILNELGWLVLSACSAAPVAQERLLDQLSESIQQQGDRDEEEARISPERAELAKFLDTHLDQLSQLGLLESSASHAA